MISMCAWSATLIVKLGTVHFAAFIIDICHIFIILAYTVAKSVS